MKTNLLKELEQAQKGQQKARREVAKRLNQLNLFPTLGEIFPHPTEKAFVHFSISGDYLYEERDVSSAYWDICVKKQALHICNEECSCSCELKIEYQFLRLATAEEILEVLLLKRQSEVKQEKEELQRNLQLFEALPLKEFFPKIAKTDENEIKNISLEKLSDVLKACKNNQLTVRNLISDKLHKLGFSTFSPLIFETSKENTVIKLDLQNCYGGQNAYCGYWKVLVESCTRHSCNETCDDECEMEVDRKSWPATPEEVIASLKNSLFDELKEEEEELQRNYKLTEALSKNLVFSNDSSEVSSETSLEELKRKIEIAKKSQIQARNQIAKKIEAMNFDIFQKPLTTPHPEEQGKTIVIDFQSCYWQPKNDFRGYWKLNVVWSTEHNCTEEICGEDYCDVEKDDHSRPASTEEVIYALSMLQTTI